MENRISQPQGRRAGQPKPEHETSDVHAGWIFGIVLFLAVSGVAIQFIMGGMLKSLKHTTPTTDRWRPGSNRAGMAPPATFPRLQVSPPVDLQAFRAREETILTTYGWVNPTSGTVRVPIDQAMLLLVQQGLPTRQGTNEAKTGPSTFELMQQRPAQRDIRAVKQP